MSAAVIVLLRDPILSHSTFIPSPTLKLPFRYDSPKRFFPVAGVNPLQENFKDLFTRAASR